MSQKFLDVSTTNDSISFTFDKKQFQIITLILVYAAAGAAWLWLFGQIATSLAFTPTQTIGLIVWVPFSIVTMYAPLKFFESAGNVTFYTTTLFMFALNLIVIQEFFAGVPVFILYLSLVAALNLIARNKKPTALRTQEIQA